MTDAEMSEWVDFGVGIAGAAAALTGLSGALYLMGAGVEVALAAGIVSSRVLVVEIRR